MSLGDYEKFGVGIPVFMGGDYVDVSLSIGYDVVFLGVPVEYGLSYRGGAKFAPNHIRKYSSWDRLDGDIYYDLDKSKKVRSNNFKIADLGDVVINETNLLATNAKIVDLVSSIDKKSFHVIVGGDHSITYPSFIGLSSYQFSEHLVFS